MIVSDNFWCLQAVQMCCSQVKCSVCPQCKCIKETFKSSVWLPSSERFIFFHRSLRLAVLLSSSLCALVQPLAPKSLELFVRHKRCCCPHTDAAGSREGGTDMPWTRDTRLSSGLAIDPSCKHAFSFSHFSRFISARISLPPVWFHTDMSQEENRDKDKWKVRTDCVSQQ